MAVKTLMHFNRKTLGAAAEHFNLGGVTKEEIVAELQEREITVADVKEALGIVDDKPDEFEEIETKDAQRVFQENSEKVFVRMRRQNPTYQVGRWTFTKAHPFQLMTRAEAELFLTQEEGFTVASQEEVQRYYNK